MLGLPIESLALVSESSVCYSISGDSDETRLTAVETTLALVTLLSLALDLAIDALFGAGADWKLADFSAMSRFDLVDGCIVNGSAEVGGSKTDAICCVFVKWSHK